MIEYTKGPWDILPSDNEDHTACDYRLYAILEDGNWQQVGYTEENAQLMQAAPDLLRACEDALNVLECNCGKIDENDPEQVAAECSFTCSRGITLKAIQKAKSTQL